MNRRPWTARQLEILRREYPTRTAAAVARKVRHSVSSVYQTAIRLGIRKSVAFLASPASGRLCKGDTRGVSGRFGPGHETWNKGRKGWKAGGRSAQTRFRPGNRPHTWQPMGTTRVTDDGILQRKVSDTGYMPADWKAVHALNWEETNGPIPRGHVVVFKDGNRQNLELANLELVTRGELMRRNSYHTRYPKEIARLIQLKGALQRQINKREQHAKQD
jgi:hypothetical protein